MRDIATDGITYVVPVPGATGEWYYGIDYEHGDLYEAEELFKSGHTVKGRRLCFISYPDGKVFVPIPKREGAYCTEPVFFEGGIYMVDVIFTEGSIRIMRFDCARHETEVYTELPLSEVKDCYNLNLHTAPLTLSRQCVADNEFEIIWPERASFSMGDHDSFFLRDKDRLFFNRWYEEGDGEDYRYWEETVIRDLKGNETEILPGDVMRMPNGEIWHLN